MLRADGISIWPWLPNYNNRLSFLVNEPKKAERRDGIAQLREEVSRPWRDVDRR